MNKCFFTVLFLGLLVQAKAQTVLFGKATDMQNQPLPFASITAIHPEAQTVIAYVLTDAQGEYRLTLTGDWVSLQIQFHLLNYKTIVKEVGNKTQQLDFKSEPEVTVLEEIVVRSSPIAQRNDTISYSLNAFSDKNDRVLADVLPRIPGIEVDDLGRIKYQGKEINKFYVEGRDLMGGAYNNITEALPNVEVSKLEILENHQPIKLLQDAVFSEHAAINIKLKRNIAVTGTGRIGAGASPALWNVKLAPLFFNSKLQALINYESNNQGIDLSHQLADFTVLNSFEGNTYEPYSGTALQIAEVAPPAIAKRRYLMNTTHLASANVLTRLAKDTELRINTHYYNNVIENQGESYTVVRNGSVMETEGTGDTIRYRRKNHSYRFEEAVKAKFTVSKNTSDSYLTNRTTMVVHRNKDRGVLAIDAHHVHQKLQSPSYNFQNALSTLIPLSGSRFLNVKSLVDLGRDKQDYEVDPLSNLVLVDTNLTDFRGLQQSYLDRNLFTQNDISMSWKVRRLLVTGELGMKLAHHKLQTELYGIGENFDTSETSYQNALNYFDLTGNYSLRLNYKGTKWRFDLHLPVYAYAITLREESTSHTDAMHKTALEPSLSLQYKVNAFWQLYGNARVSNHFTPLNRLHSKPIFSGLNFSSYQSPLSQSTQTNTGLKLEYKNPLWSFFGNVQLNYSLIDSSTLLSTEIAANGQQLMKFVPSDNQVTLQSAALTLHKFFSPLQLNASVRLGVSNTGSTVLVNEIATDLDNRRYSVGITLHNTFLDWLSANYKLEYNRDIQKALSAHREYSLNHQVELDVYPFENHSIRVGFDYQQYSLKKQKFNNRFLDLMYRYSWSEKRIDVEVQWINILNTQEYRQVLLTDLQINTTSFRLNPSQILFAVRFNFK